MGPVKNRNSRTVYTTEHGRVCPDCGRTADRCTCRRQSKVATGDGIVRVGRETKGRKGKGVTTVTGILLGPQELKDLARELKRKCGSGGTVRNGVIEIQGDHREAVILELKNKGWPVKRSGG